MRGATVRKRAFSLVELIVAVSILSIVAMMLASALVVSARTFKPIADPAAVSRQTTGLVAGLEADVRFATHFDALTPVMLRFRVPDRDDPPDGVPETIEYRFVGSGAPPGVVMRRYNDGPETIIAEGVHEMAFEVATRVVIAAPRPLRVFDPTSWGDFDTPVTGFAPVVFHSFDEAKRPFPDTLVTVPTPPGTEIGDLLVAAVVARGGTAFITPDGWTPIAHDTEGADVTLAAWWRIAGVNEPASLGLQSASPVRTYAWTMRFSGHDFDDPIAGAVGTGGRSSAPPCPSIDTPMPGALVLRLGGFDGTEVDIDEPGLAGHEPITMDLSGADGCAGGAAHALFPREGATGSHTFALAQASLDFRTLTIAIAPQEPPP